MRPIFLVPKLLFGNEEAREGEQGGEEGTCSHPDREERNFRGWRGGACLKTFWHGRDHLKRQG